MLEVKDIFKMYEGKPLLEGVSFSVARGKTVCLLGSSGSGKSTLLRIIAGLELPESGSVSWNGEDLANVPPFRRRFGLMFQDYALFPHRSVSENVAFGLRMQQLNTVEIRQRTNQALQTIDMLEFAERRVTDLSGGEQQRVALARALAPDPHLLMLDEPLGALDRSLREQLGQELRRILHETDIPAIYVTHDQAEAFAIADRLLVLHNGKILQEGSAEEIYHHPANAWVANFFGLGNLVPAIVLTCQPLTFQSGIGKFHMNCSTEIPNKGQRIWLLLRPGDAQLCTDETDQTNCFTGTVTDCIFQGDAYLISLQMKDRTNLSIQSPNPQVPGTQLTFSFPPQKILCLNE